MSSAARRGESLDGIGGNSLVPTAKAVLGMGAAKCEIPVAWPRLASCPVPEVGPGTRSQLRRCRVQP